MRNPNVERQRTVAGLVLAACSCCALRQNLVAFEELGPVRRACPLTGTTYLDRGDGLFEPDGQRLELDLDRRPGTGPDAASASLTTRPGGTPEAYDGAGRHASPDLLSDRPRRTGEKTRIELERATFAGAADAAEGAL